ncbi:MAG: hypothetical protein V4506_18525 [Bacteroidota bacterium]
MYQWFYNSLSGKAAIADDSIYLLNEAEIRYIKKRENTTIFFSALIGVIMVLVLYLPQYWWPHLFPVNTIKLPFLNDPLEFSVIAFLYGMLLVFVEIVLLTFLNIYCTHAIAFATGFVDQKSKYDADKKNLLLSIGQEKKTKDIVELGIDPYYGLKKSSVFLMNALFTLKATLSNLVFKILIQRVLGRYAVRQLMDMIGIPVFAFWNAWGTRKVLREARIIIMGQNYLNYLKNDLKNFRELSALEKTLLYDTLQYIAMSKRDYHKNHYYLSKLLLDNFEIPKEKSHVISAGYYDELEKCQSDFKQLNQQILLLGFVLDGSLSVREKIRIRKLNKLAIIHKTVQEVELQLNHFVYGKGL